MELPNSIIPTSVLVAYRSDKNTGERLGYVTYKSDEGIIKCNATWQRWKTGGGEQESVFINKPTDRFKLKTIEYQKYTRKEVGMCYRVIDPRGFEFELSPLNLMYILQHANINNLELQGDYVYAFSETILQLLPVESEAYERAKTLTALHSTKLKEEDMVIGGVYLTKGRRELTYLGKYHWNTSTSRKNEATGDWEMYCGAPERYLFTAFTDNVSPTTGKVMYSYIEPFSTLNTFYTKVKVLPDDIVAQLVEKVSADLRTHRPVKLITSSLDYAWEENKYYNLMQFRAAKSVFIRNRDNPEHYDQVYIEDARFDNQKAAYLVKFAATVGLRTNRQGALIPFRIERGHTNYDSHKPYYTKKEIEAFSLLELQVELTNQNIVPFTEFLSRY